MLRIESLKKSFGVRVLFENASYHFPDGERIALVGANGAGKTTLLNILSGLDQPDDGKLLIPSSVNVGYLPQKPNQNPAPTVLEECQGGAADTMKLGEEIADALAGMEVNHDQMALDRYE